MIFLQPLLLSLGVLIGVPFIIHLLGEKKYQEMSFSSLMFLREIEHDSLQKLQLRQWLILLSRALWISMLVLALAQPFFSSGKGSLEPGILIIDKSYSTRIDKNFLRSEKIFMEKFSHWDIMSYNDRTDIDSLKERIRSNVEKNKRDNPNLLLLSDFQDNGQNKTIIEMIGTFSTRVFGVQLKKERENFAVSAARLIDKDIHFDDMKSLEIQLSKNDPTLVPPAVFININGKRIGRAGINEKGYGYYHFSIPDNDHIPCVVSCSGDEYPEDNSRYLVIKNNNDIKILCVNEKNEANYHIKALQAMNGISPLEITSQELTSVDLDDYDMIWFSDLYPISENMLKTIKTFSETKPLLITSGKNISRFSGWKTITGDLELVDGRNAYFRLNKISGVNDDEDLRVKRYYRSSLNTGHIIWGLVSNDPLLIETQKNNYILLSPFDFDWNEMGLSPYFTRIIGELIGDMFHTGELSYEIGESIPIREPFSTIISPTGEQYRVKDEFRHTDTPGFYTVENPSERTLFAVNIPYDECLQSELGNKNIDKFEWDGKNTDSIEQQIKGRNSQTLFYILAMFFIIFEMLLLRKGERTK